MILQKRTIEQLIEDDDSPLPIEAIPNKMGINLCSVHGIEWTETTGGQVIDFTIHFIPAPEDGVDLRAEEADEQPATIKR